MNAVFLLLSIQALMGAFDNLWHHELQARLPQRVSARRELGLHAAREAIYGVVFIGLAWFEWRGGLAFVLAALLLVELGITLADFLEEDRSRRLPALERVLHTLLTISYGLLLGVLAPVLLAWSSQATALFFSPQGWVSWLCTLYGIGVLAWGLRNGLAVRHLGRIARRGVAPPPAAPAHLITPAVLITGATGFIGSALTSDMLRDGQRVILLSRDARQARASFGPQTWVIESLDDIPSETRIDAIINLAGARVLGLPWTAARRRELLASRVGTTAALVALARRLQQPPRVLVSASAVGYYGAAASFEPLDESAPARPGEFQSELCSAIEHEARRAEGLGLRVVRLRLGVVLGRGDGAYPMQALSARLGLGAVLGSGRQPAPWIHLDDAVGLLRFALSHPGLSGPVNAVAPDTPTQARFAQALASSFGRCARIRVPDLPLRTLLGEMSTLLLDGQNAVPRAATAAGYRYRFPRLEVALGELAGPPSR